jgi:hypothetical protein
VGEPLKSNVMLLQNQWTKKRRIKVKNSIVPITLCVIIPIVLVAQGRHYDEETLDLFARYPNSDALDHVARSHADREGLTRSHLVLYSTWFLDGNPRVSMQTRINADGEAYMVRSVFD